MKRTLKIRNKSVNLTKSDLGSNSKGQHSLTHIQVLLKIFKWLSHLFFFYITDSIIQNYLNLKYAFNFHYNGFIFLADVVWNI